MYSRMIKLQLANFGRSFALLLNRAMMYQINHPVIKDSINDAYKMIEVIFDKISPLVFLLNRGQLYVDEEALDPRINTSRIVGLFEANNIQSISFERGLAKSELGIFIDIFSTLTKATDAEAVKQALTRKGAFNVKVNHVLYKKVTEEDQIVSREALKKVTPMMDDQDQEGRKRFMDTLLESLLTEEFAKTLNITNLVANPAAISRKIIEVDLAAAQQTPAAGGTGLADGQGLASGGAPVTDGAVDGISTPGSGAADSTGPAPLDVSESPPGARRGVRPGGGVGPGIGAGSGRVPETGIEAGPEPGAGRAEGSALPAGGAAPGATASGAGSPPAAISPDQTPSSATGVGGHGPMLLHQLELMHREVEKHLLGQSEVELADLAQAIFEMKKQLLEGIQAQKALGIAYANEEAIRQSANKLTDRVLLELIREEYQSGNITTARLAHLIKRLIPDASELKRLLPPIKDMLLSEGMSLAEYLNLIHELRHELQDEQLSRILQESSEAIGVDSEGLIAEVKRNPDQAAELIYLAAEIRKGGGDESALTNILVEYVEQLGSRMAMESTAENGGAGEKHLKKVMHNIESTVLKQLGQMNVNTEVLSRLEQRLNERMDSVLDKMRVEWLNTQSRPTDQAPVKVLSVLQAIEHHVRDDEEMRAIVKGVRDKVDAGEIEENDFSRIHDEIARHKQILREQVDGKQMPAGVLKSDELTFVLEKEIARANRYEAQFSALAFSFVSAKPKMKSLERLITNEAVLDAALAKLAHIFRSVDIIGQLGRNKMMVLLPMLGPDDAKKALNRVIRLLHYEPLMVNEVPVQLRVAAVASGFDSQQTPDAQAFIKHIASLLTDMVARVKSIQVLF